MARCERCDGCRSMWDVSDCPYCNYPKEDTRALGKIAKDDADYEKRMQELDMDDEDEELKK